MITTSQKEQIIAALDQGREQPSWYRDLSHFGPGGGPTRFTSGALAAAQITGADSGTPQHQAVWLVLALASHPDKPLGEAGSDVSIGSWARCRCTRPGDDGRTRFSDRCPAGNLFQSMVSADQSSHGYETLIVRLARHSTPEGCGVQCRPDPAQLAQDLCWIFTPQGEDDVQAPKWKVMADWVAEFSTLQTTDLIE